MSDEEVDLADVSVAVVEVVEAAWAVVVAWAAADEVGLAVVAVAEAA